MQKFPVGIQAFSSIREGGFTYVDKTRLIYELVEQGKYYFLSRPRRFGKSLTVSTLSALFTGKKELFEGLWIADQWDWSKVHPVIHIGFSSIGYKDVGLEKAIYIQLQKIAKLYNIQLHSEGNILQFSELIEQLRINYGKVVILIDEYDKPIIDYLDDLEQAEIYRDILKKFYSVLKDIDEKLRLVFITGVSKFSKASIFSELNNLENLSMSSKFNALCGYTQEELEYYFDEAIDDMAKVHDQNREWTLAEIKKWYNGYAWGNVKQTIYNPFSILNALKDQTFRNFWFESGTPTFLIKLLRKHELAHIGKMMVTSATFSSYQIDNISPETLLFQTGYLTIKKYLGMDLYELDYPNQEIRSSMLQYLLADYTRLGQGKGGAPALLMAHALKDEKPEELRMHIDAMLHSIPYELHQDNEAYYHTVIHLAFDLIGVYIQSEIHTGKGRLDSIVQTENAIYIFEFKVNSTAEEALAQLQERGYAKPFMGKGKRIYCIGVSFSTVEKEVNSWKVEEL